MAQKIGSFDKLLPLGRAWTASNWMLTAIYGWTPRQLSNMIWLTI